MGRPKLYLVPWAPGDKQYFVNEEVHAEYLKLERTVSREPVKVMFDWKFLLKIIFFED